MKKILMLGGTYSQVPAIRRAKEMGYYVITCDYLSTNPGHAYADEYADISTTDKESVLQFAREKAVDGIIAYASDPSATTAAYVSEQLRLSGAGCESTRLLSEKDLFRQFQKENGFLTPNFYPIKKMDELEHIIDEISYPCMVKPVDSSGSKGVHRVESQDRLRQAAEDAVTFSRCGRIIVEQCIETPYNQFHGDGVVIDGRIAFLALGEQRFKNAVPIGTSFPARVDERIMRKAYVEVSRLIESSGFRCGGINVEVRVTAQNQIYVIETGPRTGGNYIPQLMQLATGEDEMTAVLQLAMGEKCDIQSPSRIQYCFQYIIGSDVNGRFAELFIDDYMKEKVVELYIHKKKGDLLSEYENSSGVVGVALLKFEGAEEMEQDIQNIKQHIKVLVEG